MTSNVFPSQGWQRENRTFLFFCCVFSMTCLGLVLMYSASYNEALKLGLDGAYFLKRQAVFAVAGFAVFALIQRIPLKWIRMGALPALIFSLALMVLTFSTPWGVVRMGARRWLEIGPLPSFQPSELLKLSSVMAIAYWYDAWGGKLSPVLLHGVPASCLLAGGTLIIFQRDYSTAVLYLSVGFALLATAGLAFRYLVFSGIVLAVPAVLFLLIEPYRIKRVVAFLFPTIDPAGLNWQVGNALKAIADGGLFGKGLGNGTWKLGLIPEVQNDFIFACIAEETGLLGTAAVFAGFSWIGMAAFRTAWELREHHAFEALMACGIGCTVCWQALVNIAVVTGLLPPTGIPLPFFSQGGTNLFMVLVECACLCKLMGRIGNVPDQHAQPDGMEVLYG